MMTFEQFQRTRKYTEDLTCHIAPDYGVELPGFVYAGDLHLIADGGGAAPDLYTLVIHNYEKTSGDLTALERELYQYGVEEGLLN